MLSAAIAERDIKPIAVRVVRLIKIFFHPVISENFFIRTTTFLIIGSETKTVPPMDP